MSDSEISVLPRCSSIYGCGYFSHPAQLGPHYVSNLLEITGNNTLLFIAEGRTAQIGLNWVTLTESGWQREHTYVEYLVNTRQIRNDDPIELILDNHTSHRGHIHDKLITNGFILQ